MLCMCSSRWSTFTSLGCSVPCGSCNGRSKSTCNKRCTRELSPCLLVIGRSSHPSRVRSEFKIRRIEHGLCADIRFRHGRSDDARSKELRPAHPPKLSFHASLWFEPESLPWINEATVHRVSWSPFRFGLRSKKLFCFGNSPAAPSLLEAVVESQFCWTAPAEKDLLLCKYCLPP